MIVMPQIVDVTMNSSNMRHYRELGYSVKKRDIISIPVEQLTFGSHVEIQVECDYCHKTIGKSYKMLLCARKNSVIKKDCCKDCSNLKMKEVNLILFGVENPMQNNDIKLKLRNTMMELYGAPSMFETEYHKEIMINHWNNMTFDRQQLINKKRMDTCINKYNVAYTSSIDPRTNIIRDNVGISISSQQKKIFDNLSKFYENIEINFCISALVLDIALFIDDIKLDLEYDAWYWHNDKKDRRRDEYLKSLGWKILRIKSSRKIPDTIILIEKISDLLESNHGYDEMVLSDWVNKELLEKEG